MLQMAQRARSGLPLLRPVWRAVLWSLTELPALLESALPPTPVVQLPLTAMSSTKPPSSMTKPVRPRAALAPPSSAAQIVASNGSTCPVVAHGRSNGRTRASPAFLMGSAVQPTVEL